MNLKFTILIFFWIILLGHAFGATSDIESLKKACLDPKKQSFSKPIQVNGKTYRGIYLVIETDGKKKTMFDCSFFGVVPIEEKEFQEEYAENCKEDAFGGFSQESPPVSDLSSAMSQITERIQCEKTSLLSPQCLKEATCNITRSAIGIATLQFSKFITPNLKNSCIGGGKSDCLTEVLAGIIKNVWSNITGIKDLGAMMYRGLSSLFTSPAVDNLERRTSESMHLASQQDDSALDRFTKNPIKAVQDFGSQVYQLVGQLIAKNFACAKWSGAPHFSNCLEPLNDWDCSSCDQKMNGFCGVVGFLGGEIVTALMTGGAINLAGKAGKIAKVDLLIKGIKPVMMSQTAQRSAAIAGKALTVAMYVPMRTLQALGKVPGLGLYLRTMDEAFMLGYKGPKAYWAARIQEQTNKAAAVLAAKQATADLIVAERDLKLAIAVGDTETAKQISGKLADLERQKTATAGNVGPRSSTEPRSQAVSDGERKFFTPEQKIEIMTDSDYRKIVQRYSDPSDQEKAIEIISILKNHNKTQLTKAQIIEEFDRYLKQCL